MPRSIYVISDLHLGGSEPRVAGSRGFRIMSQPAALTAFIDRLAGEPGAELVINGDFVDFLAEEHAGVEPWLAFRPNPEEAIAAFESIYQRTPGVFAALGSFATSHTLTILIGNHDLELALPDVRHVFESRTGLAPNGYRFLHDNEALVVGTALIEHGNRYDPANSVDHDGLRRLRSLHSRRQYADSSAAAFVPPVGSELVATVMNPIKVDYPFIDLLKPESDALFALLLALDPDARRRLAMLAWTLRRVPARALMPGPSRPRFRSEIGRSVEDADHDPDAALEALLAEALPAEDVAAFASENDSRREVSAAGVRAVLEGIVSGRRWGWQRRVERIRAAVRTLQDDQSFSLSVETGKRYLAAARALADHGRRFSHVVFGHTHQAKDLALEGGGRYLNSGAWTDRMRFPPAIMDSDLETARQAVEELLIDCAMGQVDRHIEFTPGCVHVQVGEMTSARYRAYDAPADRLEP